MVCPSPSGSRHTAPRLFRILSISITPRPPRSTLFPYTTLFRSLVQPREYRREHGDGPDRRFREGEEPAAGERDDRSEEHTSELQSHSDIVCRLLLEKKKKNDELG